MQTPGAKTPKPVACSAGGRSHYQLPAVQMENNMEHEMESGGIQEFTLRPFYNNRPLIFWGSPIFVLQAPKS